jgi:phosphatidylglycerol lysyltransferase
VVALLVVPLQSTLTPVLRLYREGHFIISSVVKRLFEKQWGSKQGARMQAAGERCVDTSAPQGRALARDLILRYGWNAMAYQILNPGMAHWFTPAGDGVVGYVEAGGAWVVAGAPLCSPERLAEVAQSFEAAARRQGRRVCYFGAQDRLSDSLAACGPAARLLLGAQPVWRPGAWAGIVARKASLRAQISRARNKGVAVDAWPPDVAAQHPALRRCLAEWLTTRGLPPMHFLVETNILAAPDDRQVLIARRAEAVVAYLVITPIPQRNGWLIEQIVRGSAAPNGSAELLVDTAMRLLAAGGATYVTLGLAPLSRHASGDESPQWALTRLLLAWVRAHGRRFYNFAGLDAFKAKLQPEGWEPIYALSRERRTSLRTLYAIAGAFGGAAPPFFLGHALLRAAAQELRWARERLRRRMAR